MLHRADQPFHDEPSGATRSAERPAFALIELLVVLVMVGIIAAISIRSVGDTIRRDRIQKAAAIISTDLEQAFALAGRQRVPMRVLIDSANRSFEIVLRSDTNYKYRTRQFVTGDLAIDFISTSRATLDVLPSGLSADTLNLKLGIYSKNGTTYGRRIRMTRGGLVRIK